MINWLFRKSNLNDFAARNFTDNNATDLREVI